MFATRGIFPLDCFAFDFVFCCYKTAKSASSQLSPLLSEHSLSLPPRPPPRVPSLCSLFSDSSSFLSGFNLRKRVFCGYLGHPWGPEPGGIHSARAPPFRAQTQPAVGGGGMGDASRVCHWLSSPPAQSPPRTEYSRSILVWVCSCFRESGAVKPRAVSPLSVPGVPGSQQPSILDFLLLGTSASSAGTLERWRLFISEFCWRDAYVFFFSFGCSFDFQKMFCVD